MNYSVIIPAAGQGKRMNMGKNKQFLLLRNIPLIIHTLRVFESDEWCDEIILVANQSEIEEMQLLIAQYQIKKVKKVVAGGSERQYSVANGVKEVTSHSIVLIHDGARPFIKQKHIHQAVIKADEIGAAVVAVRLKDTVKRAVAHSIVETLDRSSLWAVQTPQAFRTSLLQEAIYQAELRNFLGTDDASLVENIGEKVAIVEGDYFNIKITTQEDLLFAEAILARMEGK